MPAPVTVVALPGYQAAADRLFDADEQKALEDYLAYNPGAGDVIPGTGGVRKLRWRIEGRGKRGGARVIYFYHNADFPVFLFAAYAKNVQSNLSKNAQNEFQQVAKHLVRTYGKGRR
jgi:hypothetical protein